MMKTLIAWLLRLKGFGSQAAGILAAIAVALMDLFKEKPDPSKPAQRESDRGQMPADDNHDFPHTMN